MPKKQPRKQQLLTFAKYQTGRISARAYVTKMDTLRANEKKKNNNSKKENPSLHSSNADTHYSTIRKACCPSVHHARPSLDITSYLALSRRPNCKSRYKMSTRTKREATFTQLGVQALADAMLAVPALPECPGCAEEGEEEEVRCLDNGMRRCHW